KPGPGVESRRVVLEHWGQAGPMGQDWQVWQAENDRGGGFGDTMTLTFHGIGTGFGFAESPNGPKYGAMIEDRADSTAYETRTDRCAAKIKCSRNADDAACDPL